MQGRRCPAPAPPAAAASPASRGRRRGCAPPPPRASASASAAPARRRPAHGASRAARGGGGSPAGRAPAPRVARPDPPPPVYDTVDPADPHAYRRRPEWLSWWRSDWNPLTWDADEWFKTHDHAPWVEHTLALIEEGWGGLNYEPKLQDVEPPVRVRAPASPPPLTDWEVYSKQRVDARMAAQDAATLELWGSVGRWSSRHHPTGTRDVRVLNRLSDVPNYRRKVEWSEDEITALIALPEGAEKALHVHDPRFPRSVRGLRPVFPDSVEHLRGLRRPDGGPRLVDDVSPLMVATGSGWLAREFGVEGRVQLRSPRLDGFAPPGGDGEGTAGAGAVGDALLARGVADATDEDLAAVQTIEGDDDL